MSKTIESMKSVSQAVSPEDADKATKPETRAWRRWKKRTFNYINGTIPQIILSVLLLLSLFLAESWVLGNAPDGSNDALYAILLAIFVIFVVEVAILSVVQEGYKWSFFFWMDVIGTLSIILDIGWIADTFLPKGALSSQGSVIRATRTAKLGARYGRLLRLIKMMRFLKVLPCFGNSDEEDFEPTLKSIKKVSNELSNVLSLRTAALVLTIVIVEPFMSYTVNDYSTNSWITNFKITAKNVSASEYTINYMAEKMQRFYVPKDTSLLSIYVESPYIENTYYAHYHTRDVLRSDNVVTYTSYYEIANSTLAESGNPHALQWTSLTEETIQFKVEADIDETVPNQWNALFGILIIVLTILMLFIFTASFNSAVNRLVVKPLDTMMTSLRRNAMVMLDSMKALAKEKDEKEGGDKPHQTESGTSSSDDEIETAMLDKMVEKLARIVKHVIPNNNEVVADANIDKTTANWLNQSYAIAFTRRDALKDTSKISAEQARLREENLAEAHQVIVSREQLDSWTFNVLDYNNEQLCEILTYLFSMMNCLTEFNVPLAIFRSFLKEVSQVYINENTYHNFKHGCDVTHTSYRLMVVPKLNNVLSDLEVFSVLVGAVAHDIGHPGVNNVFLVNSKHELALMHNDTSPLENMHCVTLYEILRKDSTNIFVGLTEAQWREARKIIVTVILGTDMSHHFEQITKAQLFLEVNGQSVKDYCAGVTTDVECFKEEKNRLFVMELVLHCADISNPYKPFELCEKWALLVVEEFCLQGDREKKEGLAVSPMCDRDLIVLCNMQMGFIEFVMAPLVIAFVSVFPPLHEIVSNIQGNFQAWGERRKKELRTDNKPESNVEDECRKMDEKLAKFATRMSFINKDKEAAAAAAAVGPLNRRKSVSNANNPANANKV